MKSQIAWSCEPLKGAIKARPDGRKYFECNDGTEREVEPQIPLRILNHLEELLNRRAIERGEIPTVQWWLSKLDEEKNVQKGAEAKMTKELAKQWVVILQAYADGKILQLQYYDNKGEMTWFDISEPLLDGWGDPARYRVKPEVAKEAYE